MSSNEILNKTSHLKLSHPFQLSNLLGKDECIIHQILEGGLSANIVEGVRSPQQLVHRMPYHGGGKMVEADEVLQMTTRILG